MKNHRSLPYCKVLAFVLLDTVLLASPPAPAQTQVLKGHIPAAVTSLHLQPTGALPASQQLHLAIGLPLRNQPALDALIHDLYDPSSPNYHHYLTPEEFADQFGPSEEDYQAVIKFMQSEGLSVTGTSANRALLDVAGPVANIEKAFHVAMNVYQHPTEARTFYAPGTEPQIDLSIPLKHISGLDNFNIPHPESLVLLPSAQPNLTMPMSGSGLDGYYLSPDLRTAYVPGVTLTGTGQAVGLFELDGYYSNDISTFDSISGLSGITLSNVLVDGFNGVPGEGNVEVALDIEMASAMAPGLSKIFVYESTNIGSYTQPVDLLNRMATDDLAKQLSSSWSIYDDPNYDTSYLQFAAQGQSFYQSAGDYGSFYPGISEWADDTNITIVGGTVLSTVGGTTPMQVDSYLGTATLLTNGDVLCTGGEAFYLADGGYSYAELYNQTTETWTLTRPMKFERINHAAVLLANGQVLVTGGFNSPCCSWLSSAEIYDPVAGTWTQTNSMASDRAFQTATLLPDGTVLVAGGQAGYNGSPLASAEIFNPATGAWTNTQSMHYGRYSHTATLLDNGEVLVAGGIGAGTTAELYDPATASWTVTGPIKNSHSSHTATLLANGEVLVAGGSGGGGPGHFADLYDPNTGEWTNTGNMTVGRATHTATLLTNGLVLVAGGFSATAETYNPSTGTWTNAGTMFEERIGSTATLLASGQVLEAGGAFVSPVYAGEYPDPSSELFTPSTGTWTFTGTMSGPWSGETTWNEGLVDLGLTDADVATGGGVSTNYALPVWQEGIDMTTNMGSTTMRDVPDVAMIAENVFIVYDNGVTTGGAGTSVSAPLWAGFTALVNQQAISAGRATIGFVNPAIYAIGKGAHYGADFHDITTGSNTNSGNPSLFYACAGYDLCTGWGSPAGQSLINDLAPLRPVVSITTPTNLQVISTSNSSTGNVLIIANASSSGSTITNVAFYNSSTLLGNAISAPYSYIWTHVASSFGNTYKLKAVATDALGTSTTSSVVSIYVDIPPQPTIIGPTNGSVFTTPTNILLTASVTAPDDTTTHVQFYENGQSLFSGALVPVYPPSYITKWTNTWNSVPAGSYSITALATDNMGMTNWAAPVTITVNSP